MQGVGLSQIEEVSNSLEVLQKSCLSLKHKSLGVKDLNKRQKMAKLKYLLPKIYESSLPAEFLNISIEETKATCDRCLMASSKNQSQTRYQAELKCCTYFPLMPNYLVGALLEDLRTVSTVEEKIIEMIQKRQFALPMGIVPTLSYQYKFQNRTEVDFGNDPKLLCPYFNTVELNCSIWRYRSAVCTTFYCRSSYGQKGMKFWKEVSDYLTYVEMAFLEEVLVNLDFSPRQISEQLSYHNRQEWNSREKTQKVLSLQRWQHLWNSYGDDALSFYKKTYAMVAHFSQKNYQEMTGDLGEQLLAKVLAAAKTL